VADAFNSAPDFPSYIEHYWWQF